MVSRSQRRVRTTISGVTAVEALIVILVIIVLASLLLPALSSSKDAAKKTVCTSNMHQLYSALKLYESDFGEYPRCSGQVEPLITYSKTILRCPASVPTVSGPLAHINDYFLLGAPFGAPGPSAMAEAERELGNCRQKRQGHIPLVLDENHVPMVRSKTDRNHFLFVVREDGSFGLVSVAAAEAADRVCDSSKISSVYNY